MRICMAEHMALGAPKAKLVVNPGRTERQKNMRSMVRKVKKSIQVAMDDMNLKTVMANRKSLTR